MEGIAKSPPQEPQPAPEHKASEMPVFIEGVSLDMARHFGMDIFDIDNHTKRRMSDIYEWVSKELPDPSVGSILERISHVERALGNRDMREAKVLKIWEWFKINRNIKDLMKKQSSMEMYG